MKDAKQVSYENSKPYDFNGDRWIDLRRKKAIFLPLEHPYN
jgi:hypothetical protein